MSSESERRPPLPAPARRFGMGGRRLSIETGGTSLGRGRPEVRRGAIAGQRRALTDRPTAPKARRPGVEAVLRVFLLPGLIAAGLLTAAPAGAIVGGQPADPGDWRWVVAVDLPDIEDIGLCGGALIARGWVMTAAHCVYDSDNSRYVDPSRLRVRVGSYRRGVGGEAIGVSALHPHPSYDSVEDVYDVALLELATPAPEGLGAVAFPDLATHERIAPIGTRATALGWGVTDPLSDQCLDFDIGCPGLSDVLREVELPLRSAPSSSCGGVDPRAEFCAGGEPGKDTCNSDSGGPLVVQDGGVWYQIGITSSGNQACDGSRGGTYARVATFHEWIGATMSASAAAAAAAAAEAAAAAAVDRARNAAIVTYAAANAVGRGAARAAVDAIGGRYRARASAPASSFMLAGRGLRSLRPGSGAGLDRTDPGRAVRVVEAVTDLFGVGIDPGLGAGLSTTLPAPARFPEGGGPNDGEDEEAGAWTGLDWRGVTRRDLLTGSSFNVNLSDGASAPDAGGLGVWGEGAFNSFESRNAGISLDGGVVSFHLGADYQLDRWLVGLAVGQNRGDVDYEDSAATDPAMPEGTVGIELTNVLPYVQWSPDGRGDRVVWGTVGVGRGEAKLKRKAHDDSTGNLDTFMIAGGARMPLAWRVGGWDTAIEADGLRVSSETGALKTADGTVQASAGDKARSLRLRGGMEFTKTRELPNGTADMKLDLAGRLDDGYLTRGAGPSGSDLFEDPSFGAEVGGSIGYTTPSGLTAALRGRYLVARTATARKEWGASARVAYAPAGSGRGLGLSVAPVWGDGGGGAGRGVDAMWGDGRWWEDAGGAARAENGGWMPTGARVRVDYGVHLRGSRMFVTPWTEASLEDGSVDRTRIGATMRTSGRSGEGPALETFVESGSGVRPARVMLRGRVSF